MSSTRWQKFKKYLKTQESKDEVQRMKRNKYFLEEKAQKYRKGNFLKDLSHKDNDVSDLMIKDEVYKR